MENQNILQLFKNIVPPCDFWSLRLVDDSEETLCVREHVVQPPTMSRSYGAHITIMQGRGMGYAATNELTQAGLTNAIKRALNWCEISSHNNILDISKIMRPKKSGSYQSQVTKPWVQLDLNDKIQLLQDINKHLKIHDCIVDWQADLTYRRTEMLFATSDDIEINQQFYYITPGYQAVANKDSQTQFRTGGGWGTSRQGGLEQLLSFDFPASANQVAEDAIALVDAQECPEDTMSLLLMPNQMMLQIHESIGHPLELDRILGDERNYAGTSFVTADMFGEYQYGSELLNVTSNAILAEELASYAFDDEGTPSEQQYVIQNGKLLRPLGGVMSQIRANLPGVANARACDWNRPAIDRMANLNVVAGDSTFTELVASIENGVLMDSNKSWSIDDSRNKFQFGCEFARIIKNGTLKQVVRNPNYRGISANFWQSLSAVGDDSTFEVWGTPYCGKGEPNQMIHVGHASPACVFDQVDVFGGV